MIRVLIALVPLLLLAMPSRAEPAWVGPADTGLSSNAALGPARTGPPSGPSSSPVPRTSTPAPTMPAPGPSSTSAPSQPSEACRKFPNLC
jgi:hypothetical protein